MTSQRKVRVPFQPLSYNLEHLAQDNELIIDYDNSKAYIRNGIQNIEIPNTNSINDIYTNKILELIGNTDKDTLKKLEDLIKPLELWKKKMSEDDLDNLVNNLKEVINKFSDMSENEGTIASMLVKKIDAEPGKGLSTNDFTSGHEIKLNNIEDNANKYEHPTQKQCSYEAPVTSVNGEIGPVVLTKNHIRGLETVDPNANNYSHPSSQQCSHRFPVTTVNTRDGIVTVSKEEIKLDVVKNYAVASVDESSNKLINNKYLIVKNTNSAIKSLIDSIVQ